jgi:hypothetical protein
VHIFRQGDKYRGRWRFDDVKKEWVGNPARSATVEDMLEACKNKDGEGERRHSRAMSIEDMKKLYNSYLKNCPVVDPSCDGNLEVEGVKHISPLQGTVILSLRNLDAVSVCIDNFY